MPVLVWDKAGDRTFESGLDKGVLYLPDGSGVAWNGLTAVIENFNKETTSVYYDGRKINELVSLGEFSANMKAITYPDEFITLEGFGEAKPGFYLNNQATQTFGLCYRTQVGNDMEGAEAGYKIHILYNVVASPKEKTYATFSADPNLIEFEWDIFAIPEDIEGFSPTAHLIIDSLEIDDVLLQEIEDMLYGNSNADASLVPIEDLVHHIADWYIIKIIDNGDGTWVAKSEREGFIIMGPEPDFFTILYCNSVYLDEVTFTISDTVSSAPQMAIIDHNNGTWSANTDHDSLISVDADGLFTIYDANAIFLDDNTYRISDTEV